MADNTIEIDTSITVGNLADKLMLPVSKVIAELMKNGVMATVNERIDFDTAQIIVTELGLSISLEHAAKEDAFQPRVRSVSAKGQTRPPVVAVMGHVDHGKTSLLDAIRGSSVVKSEAGGITQHISAYQIIHHDRPITFLDTPGHEAFAALREHGAQLTDMVIIVVAADDGVKPQTVEAIRFAKKAGVKIVVAITKMDKAGADLNQIKTQLSEQELLVEEWGGEIVVIPVSAKAGTGIEELLDMVLLVADVEELKADFDVPAEGLIIEAHMEQGRGPIAIALVESGVIHPGDFIVAGGTYSRIRNLETTDNKPLKSAGPSTPVIITGFKNLPEFGDVFKFAANEKAARTAAEVSANNRQGGNKQGINSNELIRMIDRTNQLNELNVLIKADVQGSLTSVIDSLKGLDTEEVAIKVVASGVGAINETDLYVASTSKAIIYCFNVQVPSAISQLANRDKISLRSFDIIYELLDDAKTELSNLLAPQVVDEDIGRLLVKGVFKTTKTELICGGEVTKGKLTIPSLAKLTRGDLIVTDLEVTNLKRGPQDTKEVLEGEMCGVSLKTTEKLDIQEGDKLDFYTRRVIARTL